MLAQRYDSVCSGDCASRQDML